jgi:Tfp pilus assembly protein PilN
MATTLKSPVPAAPAGRAPRIPPIAANLLPVEIIETRRIRKVRGIVVSALVVFALLLGGWFGQARYQTAEARQSLRTAESDVQRLTRQQQAFATVVAVQAESQAIRSDLAVLLANDLRWARLLSSLRKAAPADVQINGAFGSLVSGATSSGGGSAAPQLPSASGEAPIGTLTVTGSGATKMAVAAYVDALGNLPGLANPLLGDATLQEGAVQFTVRLDITRAALGGRYTSKGGAKPSAKPGAR